MEHYKSWSGLNKWLSSCLCSEFQGRITYFLTRYHKVHDAYGRAAIALDGHELVCFEWMEIYRKESAVNAAWHQDKSQSYLGLYDSMKPQWDANCTYADIDFLNAVLEFRNLSIQDALASENYIIKILAILDKRLGKRTLKQIAERGAYKQYPAWARQFYELRLSAADPKIRTRMPSSEESTEGESL